EPKERYETHHDKRKRKEANGEISPTVLSKIEWMNKRGPYLGIVAPNNFELNPLLASQAYVPYPSLPFIDFAGRRFRFGKISNQRVVIVMTGLGMVNAGVATQLLVSLFRLKGVLHYGIAGNADVNLEIGDVTIPKYWAHSGLWNWQRYGDGIDDELALEAPGDYTRDIGYLQFSKYTNGSDNLLNRVWYQPEEIFPVTGTPEVREHIFWVPVDKSYLNLARQLEDTKLPQCVNTTCLPRPPKVTIVDRGVSASVFVDNAAYRTFLRSKFNATAVEMESAAVALICHQQSIPFVVIRALSDLAGGGSDMSNEADIFGSLAAQNSVDVLVKFVSLLPPYGSKIHDNLLNRIWYQPEEIFPVTGTPEVREHAFWVPVDEYFLDIASKLENTKLPQCVNTTCLPRPPKVTIVDKGVSASVFVDNAAYRTFLRSKFNATAVEMESAAIALISHEQNIPFIVIRALSDLAGGGSEISNEADIFGSLAAVNSVDVLVKFVGLLPQYRGSKVQSE
ncbi:hypothetical protein HID58_012868, partial [Brassica napus]